MEKRNFKKSEEFFLANIFCAEKRGFVAESENLLNKFVEEYKDTLINGYKPSIVALSAAIKGAAMRSDMSRLAILLKKSLVGFFVILYLIYGF